MKKKFIGFYDPSKEEVKKAWQEGIFAFDANSILNLYRYSNPTQRNFLAILKSQKEKLFLPYQAALEFHKNRVTVKNFMKEAYSYLLHDVNDFEKSLEGKLNTYKKHPTIKVENIIKLYDKFIASVKMELDKQRENHPSDEIDDVLNEITEIFEGKVGDAPSIDLLQKLQKEGNERYSKRIPPGYKDGKKENDNEFGDYILWTQLIDKVKKEKSEIVFITDDRKEDWWRKENGKTLRPREELIKEFYDQTGVRILIYNADNFLEYAKENKLIKEIEKDTIKEIKEVKKSDYMEADFLRTSALNVALSGNPVLLKYGKVGIDHSELIRSSITPIGFLDSSVLYPKDHLTGLDQFGLQVPHGYSPETFIDPRITTAGLLGIQEPNVYNPILATLKDIYPEPSIASIRPVGSQSSSVNNLILPKKDEISLNNETGYSVKNVITHGEPNSTKPYNSKDTEPKKISGGKKGK